MSKRILALCVAMLLSLCALPFAAYADNTVTGTGGVVTIHYEIGKANTPVIVVVLPQLTESGADVTAARMAALQTDLTALEALPLAYAKIVRTNENGVLEHTCRVNSSLPTGIAYVYLSYLGTESWVPAATFEHVEQGDIERLLGWFNDDEVPYETIITWDEEGRADDPDTDGDETVPAVQVLRKSSAGVDAYEALGTEKSTFCSILKAKKPAAGFTITELVSLFNESVAWTQLRSLDTLTVLNTYNGTTVGKYWDLPLAETDAFSLLSGAEQTRMLTNIKTGAYSDKATLERDFAEDLVLSVFRDALTREELEAIISAEGAYSTYFAAIRSVLSDAGLDAEDKAYERAEVMNAVLVKNSQCLSLEAAKALFTNALPSEGSTDNASGGDYTSHGSVGASSRGGGGTGVAKVKEETAAEAEQTESFNDVADSHWAADYIQRLYDGKVINGTGDGAFSPASPVRRQDFVKILVGALGMEQTDSTSIFTDVAVGSYYEPFVMTAVEKGLIFGKGEGIFGGEDNISREDAAVIMSRTLALYNMTAAGEGIAFADGDAAAEYAGEAIAMVSAFGIFTGDELGCFNPKAELSRAETCAILCRLADLIQGGAK